jgi:hypothetical protein
MIVAGDAFIEAHRDPAAGADSWGDWNAHVVSSSPRRFRATFSTPGANVYIDLGLMPSVIATISMCEPHASTGKLGSQ